MSREHDPWALIRGVFPLVVTLLVGTATILLVSLALPILIPVALVVLAVGLLYLWLKSSLGHPGGPRHDD